MEHYPAAFISGAIAMGYLVVAVFFLKFWRRTLDRLFLAFGVAFILLSCSQVMIRLILFPGQELAGYALRLVAFLLIIAAILGKNLRGKG